MLIIIAYLIIIITFVASSKQIFYLMYSDDGMNILCFCFMQKQKQRKAKNRSQI